MREKIISMVDKLDSHRDLITSEEATKQYLVLPFIRDVLGYNIESTEVLPEYTAKLKGIKGSDKVDYVITKNNEPIILVECKKLGEELSLKHEGQLLRYFTPLTTAKIAVLTNGQKYNFYTDSESPNILDNDPYLVLDLADRNVDSKINHLEKLRKNHFDLNGIINSAKDLKYINIAKNKLHKEFNNLEDMDLVYQIIKDCNVGTWNASKKEDFKPICKKAMELFLNEKLDEVLNKARKNLSTSIENKDIEGKLNEDEIDQIITTEEELEGYHIVKSILRDHIDLSRVFIRDSLSYCAVIIDNNNRQPLVRLHLNSSSNKRITIFKENKEEIKVDIASLYDIYNFAEQIIATAKSYKSK